MIGSRPLCVSVSAVLLQLHLLFGQSAPSSQEESLKRQRESLEKQRQAVSQQWAAAATQQPSSFFTTLPSALATASADCPALDSRTVDHLVAIAARKHNLDPSLVRAVMRQESAFKPCAVSDKGAQGLMQLMPATARELRVNNVFDPKENVLAGAAYLRQMLDRYHGDLRLALVAYNAGPSRADQPAGVPYPLETQDYVSRIFDDLGFSEASQDPAKPEETSTVPAAPDSPSLLPAGSHLKHPAEVLETESPQHPKP